MSWASYEWKEGLPLKALQKIEELERHRDKLRKELQQRQFQIDTIEQVMTKQRQKFEIEKAAQSTLSTDNKMLMDTCNQLEAKQHRTEHELQMKDARIQHLTDSLAQSKKSLDSESQKISSLERQLEKFEKVVDLMEAKEKRSEVEMKKVKDMLQDQHWHDVAQIASERDATGQLKVELMRARNHHMMSTCGLTRDRSNSGDHSMTSESNTTKHDDSSELRELRERVTELTAKLGDKIQECQDTVAERDSFEEKYKSGLHMHKEQVDEYLENLTQLRTEHQQMLEQCAPSMLLLQKLDVDQLPLPPFQQMRNKRPLVGNCSPEHELKKSKSQIPSAISRTKMAGLVRNQAMDPGQTLTKGNTQHQDLPPLLQDDYDQSCDRIAQLVNQLDEAKCKYELEKKRNATEKKKLEDQIKEQLELTFLLQCDFDQACENDVKLKRRTATGKRRLMLQIKELKGENANLKARLSDAATDREKQEMNGKKRKNLVVDNQALSSKLQAKTASHGRLQSELVQMTSRWKSLEQQVKSKVGMLTMFGEKLQRAEGVATSLEKKLEMKKANIEDTEGLLHDLTNKYDALKGAYEVVCKQLDDRNQGTQLVDTRCEDPRSHGLPMGEGKGEDKQVQELSDKLVQAETTLTQLRSKVNQLQDMKINGEMLTNKKQQQIRKLEDQARQDSSQMTDLQKAIDGQKTELETREKALTALRERLSDLEAQVTREKDGAAQSVARATTEQQTLEVTVMTLQKEAGDKEATINDLRLQVENAQRLNQSQTERCKQLEEKNKNLEKASGLLGDEKQNVDLNMHELSSELATVREKASAMEVQQRQKVDTVDAEMATMKKEYGESMIQSSERLKTLQSEVDERKLSGELLQQQFTQQKDAAEKMAAMLDSVEQERERIAGELSAARDECVLAIAEQTKLKCSSECLVDELRGSVGVMQAERSALQLQLVELGERLEAKCGDVQGLTNAKAELTRKNDQLLQEKGSLKDSSQQLQASVDELRKSCDESSAQVVAMTTQLEEANREWVGKLERADDTLVVVREKLRISDIENDSLKMELSVTGSEVEKRDGDRRVAEARVTELTATSDVLQQQAATEKEAREGLALEVQRLSSERDKMAGKLESCERELMDVSEKQVEAGCKAESLVASLRERLSALEEEKGAMKQEIEQAALKLDRGDETAIVVTRQLSQFKEQNEQLVQQIEDSKASVEQLRSALLSSENEKHENATALEGVGTELTAMKSAQEKLLCESTGLIENLRRRQKETENEKVKVEAELEGAMAKLGYNEETAGTVTRDLSRCKEDNEQLLQQIKDSKDVVEQLKSMVSTLEEEKSKATAEVDATNDELNSVRNSQEKSQCELTGLIDDLRERQKAEEDKRIALQAELQEVMVKLDGNEENMTSTVRELSQCRESNEQLLQQIQESKNVVEQLKSAISTLEAENGKTAAELEAAKDELSSVKDDKEKSLCESSGLIEELRKREREAMDAKVALMREFDEAIVKINSNEEIASAVAQELSQCKEHNEQLLQQNGESKGALERLEMKVVLTEKDGDEIAVELEAVKVELASTRREQEVEQCRSAGLVEELRQQGRAAEERAGSLQKELEEASLKLDDGQEVMSGVVQELESAREREAVLLQQLELGQHRLVAMETAIEEATEEKGALVVRCEKLTVDLETGRAGEAETTLKQEALVVELRRQVGVANAERDAAKDDVDTAAFKLENVTEDAECLTEQLESSAARQTQLEQRCVELKASLGDVERRLEESEEGKRAVLAAVEAIEGKVDCLKAEVAAGKAEEENVGAHMRQLEDDVERRTDELIAARGEVDKLQVALTAEQAFCSGLKQEKCELENDLDVVRRHVVNLGEEKTGMLSSIERLETAVAASSTDIDELRQEVVRAEETNASQTRSLADQTHSAEKALSEARQRCDDLQTRLDIADIERGETEGSHAKREVEFEMRTEKLRVDIVSCQTENNGVSAQLKEAEFSLAAARQERATLQSVTERNQADVTILLETHRTEIKHRESLQAGLVDELRVVRAELGGLAGDLARSKEVVSDLEQQLSTTQEELLLSAGVQRSAESERCREGAELQKRITELEAVNVEKSHQVETLEGDLRAAKTSADCCEGELQMALQTHVGKVREVELRLRETETLHVSEMDSLVSEHAFKVTTMQEAIDTLQRDEEKRRGEVQDSADQLQALRTEYTSELATAKRELDLSMSISQTTKEEMGQLKDKIVDAREALGRKEEELRAATDDLASVKAELSAKTEEMVQAKYVAETRLREMEAACSKLDAQLRVAYDCGEETEQQLREETNEITLLKQQIVSLEASMLELDTQKNEVKEESRVLTVEKDGIVARNQKECDDHKTVVSELEQKLCQARERADNGVIEIVTLRDSISALEKTLSSDEDRRLRERADLSSQMQRLENNVKEKQCEVDRIQTELDVAVASADEQAIAAQSKSAELLCALREMERTGLKETRQLEAQLVDLRAELEFAAGAAESEKASLQTELTAIREQLHETKDANHAGDVKQTQATAERESELIRLTAAVERLERQSVASDQLLSAARSESSTRAEELFETTERIKFLEEESTQAGRASEQELECAREKLHQVEASLSDAQGRLASGNEEMVTFEQKLSEAVTVEAQLRQQVVSLEDSCRQTTVENDAHLLLIDTLRQQIVDDSTRTESETSRLNITVQELQLKLAQVGEAETERDGRRSDTESCLAVAEKKLAAAKDEIVELEGKLSEAGTAEAQLRQQVSSLEATREQMRMSAEEREGSLRDVTERFDRFVEQSNCDVSNLKQAAVALEKRCQEKQDSLAELKEELIAQKDACDLIKSNEEKAAKTVKEQELEIDFLTGEVENAEEESEEQLEHIQKLEGTIVDVQTSSVMATCELQMHCQRLGEQIRLLQAVKSTTVGDVVSLQNDLEERCELLEVENDAVMSDIAGLKETILQVETDKKIALADISTLEDKICRLQEKLTGAGEQRDAGLSDSTEKLKKVEDQLARALEQHVASLALALASSECSDEQRCRIATLEAENLQLGADLTEVRKSETDVKAAQTLAEADNLNVTANLQTVESDLLALTETSDIASVETSELRTKLLHADHQMSALSRDFDDSETKTCELLETVGCLEAEKKDLTEKLVSAENEKSVAMEKLNTTETEMSTLRAEVESVRTDAREENAGLHNQLEVKQMECGALTEQLQETQEQLCELGEQKSQLIEQLCELQSHLSQVSSEKDVVVNRCEAVEAELRQLNEVFTQADVEQEELRSTVEQLRSTTERLEQEKCDAETKVEETTELLQVIQVESEGLQEDVEEYKRTLHDDRVRLEAMQAEKEAADVTAADSVDAVTRRGVEVTALRKELKDTEMDWESKSREVEELGRTVARLEWDARDGERETRRLEETCSDTRTAHEDCLAELDTARHQYGSAMERVDDLETSAARHEDSVEILKAKVTAMLAESNRLRQELVQLTADAMAEQAQATQRLTEAQRDLETTRQGAVALEQQLLEQRAQGETVRARLEEEVLLLRHDREDVDLMVYEKNELELESAELFSKVTAFELEKEELVSQTKALELEKEELVSQTKALELEKEELVSQTKALELEKEELVTQARTLELEKEELVSQARTLELEKEELVSQARTLELEKAELVSQVTALQTTIMEQVKELNISHAETTQELTQVRSKLKLVEQLSEDTQAELAILRQEKDDACSELLRLKEEVGTLKSSDDDAKLKTELEKKTKDSDVWMNRYQSLLKRYHLIEGENDELKDKLEGPVVVQRPRSRMSTKQGASQTRAKHGASQGTGQTSTKQGTSQILTKQGASQIITKQGASQIITKQGASQIMTKQSASQIITKQGASRITRQSASRISATQSVSTKRPSDCVQESGDAKKNCRTDTTCNTQTQGKGQQDTPNNEKPKALAVITNSPKKSARPAVKIATKPIAMPTVPSPSVPATRCLSLKRTPKRLSRKRLEPSSTETSDEKNAEKKNAENCDVQ